MTSRIPSLYYFSVFFAGLSVMTAELSFTRLLAPYFGDSLFVWTNLLGLIMFALAMGYYWGGIIADKHSKDSLYFLLLLAVGIWLLWIPFISGMLFSLLTLSFVNLSATVLWGSFLAALILMVPPMIVLGMVVPYTVKLVNSNHAEVGRDAGRVSMVSTAGSLLGTFLPAFVLIPTIGTVNTFLLLGLLLVVLASFGLKRWEPLIFFILGMFLFTLAPPVLAYEGMVFEKESPYGHVFVLEDESGRRTLHINNVLGTQSIYDPNVDILEEYYSYFALLPAGIDAPKSALILGHAGGSFTRLFNELYPDLEITGVELDPLVTQAAREVMGLDELEVDIHHADARGFLQNTNESYDLILVDAYHATALPPHMATKDFFELCKEHLNKGGIVALNSAAAESELLDVLLNTMATVFGEVFVAPVKDSYNTMILGGSDGDFEDAPEVLSEQFEHLEEYAHFVTYDDELSVFTDDKSSFVELLTAQMLLRLLSNY